MDITSSGQSDVDPDTAVDQSGHSTRDTFMHPASNLAIWATRESKADVHETSQAKSSDLAQHHTTYHPHPRNGNTVPLHDPPPILTSNDRCHNHSPPGRSRSNSHNNTQIIHEGSYAHIPDYPGAPAGFTPINQHGFLLGLPQHYYRSPYV